MQWQGFSLLDTYVCAFLIRDCSFKVPMLVGIKRRVRGCVKRCRCAWAGHRGSSCADETSDFTQRLLNRGAELK